MSLPQRTAPRFADAPARIASSGSAVRELAMSEFRLGLRNRWAWVFTVLFALAALAVGLAGGLAGGELRINPFPRVAVSLLHLSLYVVPLAGLLAGISSFSETGGRWDLLLSQPISRAEVIVGKAMGVWRVLLVSILAGFGLAGLFIAGVSPTDWPRYLALTAVTAGLALDFVALGIFLAVVCGRRPVAMAVGPAVWFTLVIVYDLAVAGAVLLTRGGLSFASLFALLAANPVDLARTLGLLAAGSLDLLGPGGALMLRLAGPGSVFGLALMMLLWAAVLLGAAAAVFKRQDA